MENCAVVGRIFARAAEVARRLGVAEGGYRIVNNCGKDGGQTVSTCTFTCSAAVRCSGLRAKQNGIPRNAHNRRFRKGWMQNGQSIYHDGGRL